MFNFGASDPLTVEIGQIHCGDRWIVYQRLQELSIPCWCSPDGSLQVQIDHPVTGIQVRSIVMQLTATRSELIGWLESCWLQ